MAEHFSIDRNIELSTIKYLEDNIDSSWSNVSVVKSFTQAYKESLPVVAINLQDVNTERREVGSTTLSNTYTINIHLFCANDGFRIDLAYFIRNLLKESWDYYSINHTSGTPEELTYTSTTNKIWVDRFNSDMKIDFGDDSDKYDKHRHFISITLRTSYDG